MRSTLLFVLILTFFVQAQEKVTIAVNDLTGHSVSENDTKIISERLRSELINTNLFRVMERGEMDQILKEQGFQMSGACDDGSCMVEAGQLLGVEQIVTGSVGLIGSMYTLNIKMIAVESGEISLSVSHDYDGKISELLSVAVREVAIKIRNSLAEAQDQMEQTSLSITSTPQKATVFIDGKEMGSTPLADLTLNAGTVKIVLSKRNFQSVDTTVTLQHAARESLNFTLPKEDDAKRSKRAKIIGFSVGGTVAAGGAIAALIMNSKLKSDQQTYNELSEAPQAQYDQLRSDMNKAKLIRNISYGVSGAGLGLVALTLFF